MWLNSEQLLNLEASEKLTPRDYLLSRVNKIEATKRVIAKAVDTKLPLYGADKNKVFSDNMNCIDTTSYIRRCLKKMLNNPFTKIISTGEKLSGDYIVISDNWLLIIKQSNLHIMSINEHKTLKDINIEDLQYHVIMCTRCGEVIVRKRTSPFVRGVKQHNYSHLCGGQFREVTDDEKYKIYDKVGV